VSGRALRADAARNRERVMQAAVELFARDGVAVAVPDVAARAGVGRATVYRSFPTKQHLVAAVLVERLRWFEAQARAALQGDDAWVGFCSVIAAALGAEASDHTVAASLDFGGEELPELAAARADARSALIELMDRAKAQGAMRSDATPADVRLLFNGPAYLLAADGVADPAAFARVAELLAAALKS
jgi:AcrR family transcriptional regulator